MAAEETGLILCADARAIPLIDGCVQTVVTSPPYWGLRDYGLTPTAWGGDPLCPHEWGAERIITNTAPRDHAGAYAFGATRGTEKQRAATTLTASQGCWCSICGAWCGCLGLEPTPDLYVEHIVEVFREVARVLRNDGTLWLNLGDSYANDGKWGGETGGKQSYLPDNDRKRVGRVKRLTGLKSKDLVGIPWMVAFALRADGWYLRSDIIWAKPNPMPESVTDRPTKSHEYLFLLSKSERYHYDAEAIAEESVYKFGEGGHQRFGAPCGKAQIEYGQQVSGQIWNSSGTRNKRSVWTVATQPYSGSHFATFPEALIEPCILAGAPLGGLVFDPFLGSGTVGLVAERLGRQWVGTDLTYHALSQERTAQRGLVWS